MGLSIHYNGQLRNPECLPTFVEEVRDIAKIYQWPYTIFETEFPLQSWGKNTHGNGLYGISFTPPGCETISLSFLSNGKLVSIWSWRLFLKRMGEEEQILEGGVSVKTQYAGEVIHKIIIHFLDHLSKKYFSHFSMTDEGQYWETRDEKLLHKNFNLLTGLINAFQDTLETNPINRGETFEEYFKRILEKIHAQNKFTE